MFLDDFEPLYEISSSELSQVYAAKRYDTGKEVIVKVLQGSERIFSKHNGILVPDEILINKKLNNPRMFQKWEEFFFESGVWFIVFEADHTWCNLADYLAEHGAFSEGDARYIMNQLYEILTFCHLHDVDPRNLCPANLLINPENRHIKLSNFEQASTDLNTGKSHISEISDGVYLPPEFYMTGRNLPMEGAVWAVGCLLFELVFARRPLFVTANDFEVLETLFRTVSTDCIRFLKGCLSPLARKRLKFEMIKQHPWFPSEINV